MWMWETFSISKPYCFSTGAMTPSRIYRRSSLISKSSVCITDTTTVSMPTFAKPFNIADAKQYMSEGKVLIFGCGTGSPFFSTDTGAVLKAAELGVDAVLFAKNIDGVYTADPKVDKSARKLESITYGEILAKNLGVMDLAAAAFCQSNSLTTVVFGLNEPSSVERVVSGEALGTLVTV